MVFFNSNLIHEKTKRNTTLVRTKIMNGRHISIAAFQEIVFKLTFGSDFNRADNF